MRYLKYFLILAAFAVLSLAGTYYYFTRNLPSLATLEGYHPNLVTNVYSHDGRLIGEFYIERRVVVSLNKMPPHLIKAFLAAEDAQFFEHEGINYMSIFRALIKNIRAGKVVQGGSTITQQLAKSFLTSERKLSRKVREAIMAYRIEKELDKDEILSLYLNQIYFGNGAYGVQTAAESYFGKNVEDIDLAEAAMLAGLPKAPSRYSPRANFDLAKRRQEFILGRMVEELYITPEEADKAIQEKIRLKPKKTDSLWVGPYFTEHVRRYIEEKYGEDMLYKGGLKVYTTLDVEMQKAANRAVREGLREHDKRRGYRGPVSRLNTIEEMDSFRGRWDDKHGDGPLEPEGIYEGVVTSVDAKNGSLNVDVGSHHGVISPRDLRWARLYNPTDDPNGGVRVKPITLFKTGDVIEVMVKAVPADPLAPIPFKLEQEPRAEAALMAMEPSTGAVRAMVGGSDFSKTQFNRAVQAHRQPGSAFKPIIYTAAIDKGYTPATVVIDSPIVFEEAASETASDVAPSEEQAANGSAGPEQVEPDQPLAWRPRNYDEKFWGPTTVRDALRKSRNVITIKILNDIGVKYAISYARLLGISSPLARDLSIALGSSALTLSELTTAFATLDNMGKRPDPLYITKIVDRDGNVIEENRPFTRSVISPQTAYIMTSLLQSVIEHGTGFRARALGRPAAGKTGTTNSLNDAWFMGYVPGLVAGSWVGYDDEKPLGKHETGSRAALPIWLKFMKAVTADRPVENFHVPDGVEFARIDPKTGTLATPQTAEPLFEVFKAGTAPVPTAVPPTRPRSSDFFLIDTSLPRNNDIMIEKTTTLDASSEGPSRAALPPPGTIDAATAISGSAEGLPHEVRKLRIMDLNN
ncbi:MAG: penicillin-binding protein 1A [Thermodesulfobacteriota bacterium]